MTRYVVVANNLGGAVRVFGAFHDRAKAEALAARVNERIEKIEDADFAEYRADADATMAPDGYGRCGVLIVHPWSARRAEKFALGEYDS